MDPKARAKMAGIVNKVFWDVSRGNRLTTAKKSTKSVLHVQSWCFTKPIIADVFVVA